MAVRPLLILIVDDSEANRLLISKVLEHEGYEVVEARDGEEGWRTMERIKPDLVVLDYEMPAMTGWQFARKARQEGIAVPIILMSASLDAEDAAAALDRVDFLPKPFSFADLYDKISALVRSQ